MGKKLVVTVQDKAYIDVGSVKNGDFAMAEMDSQRPFMIVQDKERVRVVSIEDNCVISSHSNLQEAIQELMDGYGASVYIYDDYESLLWDLKKILFGD